MSMQLPLILNEKQVEKLNFIIKETTGISRDQMSKFDYFRRVHLVIEDSIQTLYKKTLSDLNCGEDHDGKELTQEII